MKFEALDRIHVIQTMMSQFLVYVSDNAEDEYHQGLSPQAKELVGKAMEYLCDAYQKQGVYAFEEELNEAIVQKQNDN